MKRIANRTPARLSWTLLAAGVLLNASCSSSTGGGGPEGGTTSSSGGESGSGTGDGAAGATAVEGGGPVADGSGADGMAQCPSFASSAVQCSLTCFGRCYGTNAGGTADPSNHIGDCYFTATGNILEYCAPYGASDPCSLCP